ncbi:MAG: DUF4178 domain-containing protein [Acidobacteriota bacterium]
MSGASLAGYEAPCPSCGSPVTFRLGDSVMAVCPACSSAVVRQGVDLATLGEVAQLIPTPSLLSIGIEGRTKEEGRFQVVGRLQLDHGAGTWDEWHLAFEDGHHAWLSESQGKFHLVHGIDVPPLASFSEHDPGETVDLGSHGTWVIAEVRQARFMAAAGELPSAVEPGALLNYADIQGPKNTFGTLDYGTGESCEAVYLGREIALSELGFSKVDLPDQDERATAAAAKTLTCPQCGGPLEITLPDETQRVGCPWCGSLLDAKKDFEILSARERVAIKPHIPLGTKGRLRGVEWAAIGHIVKYVEVYGTRYYWQEYLLHSAQEGFRWLTYQNGHWSFVEPISAAEVGDAYRKVHFRGESYKRFQSGEAIVSQVLGELYWQVSVGDTSSTADYIRPPYMVSAERTAQEINWSLGTYVDAETLWSAFGMEGSPPMQQGIAPHQPTDLGVRAKSAAKSALLATVLLLAFQFFVSARSGQVFDRSFPVPQAQTAEAGTYRSDPFELRRGRTKITLNSNLKDYWIRLSGLLIHQESGDRRAVNLMVHDYHPHSKRTRVSAVLAGVPPGDYVLQLTPDFPEQAPSPPRDYRVSVRTGVTNGGRAVFLGFLLWVWPFILSVRNSSFESRRWAESDEG